MQVFDTIVGRRTRALPSPASWCPWRDATCPDRSEPVDTRWLDVCVRADGAVLAVGGGRARDVVGMHRLELWTAGRPLRVLSELTGRLERARFSPDCARVATTTPGGQGQSALQVFDVQSGEALGERLLPGADVHLAWSPDAARIAIATGGAVSLWNLPDNSLAVFLPEGVLGGLFDAAGQTRRLDAVPEGARAWLQAEVVGPIRYGIRLPERYDAAMYTLSGDGRRMARARGALVDLMDLEHGEVLPGLTLSSLAWAVSLNALGTRLAIATSAGVEVRSVPGGGMERRLERTRDDALLLWADRGDTLAIVDHRGGARAFDVVSGDALATLAPGAGTWPRLPVGADRFARLTPQTLSLWNARTPRTVTLPVSVHGFRRKNC